VSSFDKHNRSFNEGCFDLPGSDRPRDAAEKALELYDRLSRDSRFEVTAAADA
jgi:hypothetical protein